MTVDIYHCDYHGKCKRKPYAEVFPHLRIGVDGSIEGGGAWYYLCFIHFIKERLLKHVTAWCKAEKCEDEF